MPSSINDRVQAIMEGERFSLAKPMQSHIDDYTIAAGDLPMNLVNFMRWLRLT